MTYKIKISLLLIILTVPLLSQGRIKYYDIDKVMEISGEVKKKIIREKYKRSDFVILKIIGNKGLKKYLVEVSPIWFYKLDLSEGDSVKVRGSLNIVEKQHIILCQSIIFKDKTYLFRDKYGFPLWRGGRSKLRTKGRQRRRGQERF